jgi:hypothetical protein
MRYVAPDLVVAHLARLCAQAGAATTAVGGTIGLRVHGAAGGTWVLDLTVPGARVVDADDAAFRAATVRVFSFARSVGAIAFAPEEVVDLLETGELVVQGDAKILERLSCILGRAASPLGARLSSLQP